MNVRAWIIGLLVVVGVGQATASAHMRDYLVNRYYYTAKRNEVELELWNDVNFSEADNDDSYNSTHQIELEYGVTDHVQLAYYEVYTWNRAKDWERDAFKIEAKARFAEAGQWPVDVALYTEYENPDGSRAVRSDVLENKVIVSQDVGNWNIVGNFTFEKPLNSGEPWVYEYTAGVSYAVTPTARLGLEIMEGLGTSDTFGDLRSQELQLIPGFYANLTPNIRVLVGPAFGLTRSTDDFQLKSLVEYEF